MKKLFLFALVAFAISCSKDAGTDQPQTPDQPSEQPEKVTVSFAVKGDVTIEEDPLSTSRAAGVETESTDLYGINIYYDEDKDGVINDVYGYGLFDNVADMTVSLLTGYKYKFVCSLVKDGKNKIFTSTNSSNDKEYYSPFQRSGQDFQENSYYYDYYSYDSYSTILGNKFVLGTDFHLTGLGQGRGDKNDGYSYSYFPADRYYGETTDYIPKEGGVVNISMKRCAFGAKFVVTGVTDGEFTFFLRDNRSVEDEIKRISGITSDTTYEGEIFTYDNVYGCWKKVMEGQDFSQDFMLYMYWTRGNGVTQELDPLTVTFKRNIMTTVNIRLNGGDTNNSFHLEVDNAEMGNENTNLDVDAGDMNDTPVDPTK